MQLVQSLVFHVLCGAGTLAVCVQQLASVKVSDSDARVRSDYFRAGSRNGFPSS